MTMMKILEKKGYLIKSEAARAHVYRAAKSRKRVLGAMVSEFVDRVFSGAAKPLLVHLLEERRLSAADRAEIKRLLKDAKEK